MSSNGRSQNDSNIGANQLAVISLVDSKFDQLTVFSDQIWSLEDQEVQSSKALAGCWS